MRFLSMSLFYCAISTLVAPSLAHSHPGRTDARGCHQDTSENSIHCREGLKITNIRIGQGDATLIQGPVLNDGTRVNVLFDAGHTKGFKAGSAIRVVLGKNGIGPVRAGDSYKPRQDLDYLIISHDDADHLNGATAGRNHGTSFILGYDNSVGCPGDDDDDANEDWISTDIEYIAGKKKGKTETKTKFYAPDEDELGKCDDLKIHNFVDYGFDNFRMDSEGHYKYRNLVNAFVRQGATKINIDNQDIVDTFEIDLGRGAKMICYAGNGFVRGGNGKHPKANKPNELSLAFLVTYGEFDFLIAGDLIGKHGSLTGRFGSSDDAHLELPVGEAIVADGRDVDILHVNHHGANNGSEIEFLKKIRPNIAIISSGNDNTHDHPTNHTLRRLEDAGVYRIIQTSWGNPAGRVSNEVRNRQSIYQNDVVIHSNGKTYEISTSREYSADEYNVPLEE